MIFQFMAPDPPVARNPYDVVRHAVYGALPRCSSVVHFPKSCRADLSHSNDHPHFAIEGMMRTRQLYLLPKITTRLISTSSTPTPSSAASSTSSSRTPRRRTLIDLAAIGIVGLGLSSFLIYTSKQRAKESSLESMPSEKRGVFTVPIISQLSLSCPSTFPSTPHADSRFVRHRTGSQTTKTLTLLSPHETRERLRENEASYSVNRQKNPVFRYDVRHPVLLSFVFCTHLVVRDRRLINLTC